MSQGRILIIRGGAIGDFVLTLPVLQALRRQFPDARLEVLGYPQVANLAIAGGWADATRPIEAGPLAGFFARNGNLDPEWMAYFGSFDIVLSYLFDPDHIFQANLERSNVKHYIAGPHRPMDEGSKHATEVLLEPLAQLAIAPEPELPNLRYLVGHAPRTSVEPRMPPRHIAIHPGSGSKHKNWPLEAWVHCVELLCEDDPDRTITIIAGEAERDEATTLLHHLPDGRAQLWMGRPLVEVAQDLSRRDAFIGHDSGITHMAAALGLPCIVLWGPTIKQVWSPQGPHVRILESKNGICAIPPSEVLDTLNRLTPP